MNFPVSALLHRVRAPFTTSFRLLFGFLVSVTRFFMLFRLQRPLNEHGCRDFSAATFLYAVLLLNAHRQALSSY